MVPRGHFCDSAAMSDLKEFIRIDANGPGGTGLPPTVHDPSDTAIAGATDPLGYTAYTAPTAGIFTAGVWACDAGTLEIRDLAIDEACYLLEGEGVITDRYGNSAH